jgi:hypothetical protein
MAVKIYLRSIVKHGENHLAMFDSNREGDISNLTTDVPAGEQIIWKADCCSGIKRITKIASKDGKGNIFKNDPKKLLLCKGFKLQVPDSADGKEAYSIEYILHDDTKVIIDPYIRIPPPKIPGQ